MGVSNISIIQDLVLNEEVMNQLDYLGVTGDLSALDDRVDALETAVGILEEGGEIAQGTYLCGDWTDENTGAIIFGEWTAAA